MKEKPEICKCCEKVLIKPQDKFHVKLFSEQFWDGAETGYILEKMTFCYDCAVDIKNTVKKLTKK